MLLHENFILSCNLLRYTRHDKRSKLPGWILSHLRDAHLNLSTDMAVHIAKEVCFCNYCILLHSLLSPHLPSIQRYRPDRDTVLVILFALNFCLIGPSLTWKCIPIPKWRLTIKNCWQQMVGAVKVVATWVNILFTIKMCTQSCTKHARLSKRGKMISLL